MPATQVSSPLVLRLAPLRTPFAAQTRQARPGTCR